MSEKNQKTRDIGSFSKPARLRLKTFFAPKDIFCRSEGCGWHKMHGGHVQCQFQIALGVKSRQSKKGIITKKNLKKPNLGESQMKTVFSSYSAVVVMTAILAP
jgi:hypothetical protein